MAMRPASSSRWLSRLWSRLLTRRGCLCISLLLLLRASLWRSSASRCLAAPPTWRALDGTLMRATTAPTTRTEPSFILLWSTDESQFRLVSKRALEAIFFHHPYASVRVFSNTLPLDFLSPLSAAGFRASVHRYNLSELLAETPAAAWISSTQPEAEEGPYYYSHLTDVLRLALLYKEGGVYLDSDVLLLRPFRLADVPTTHASLAPAAATAPMRNAIGIESYTGSSWSPFRNHVLNGAVLVFPPSSPFLWNAMDEFARTYNPKLWGWNGPELLTRVHARCGFGGDDEVQVHWRVRTQLALSTRFEAVDARVSALTSACKHTERRLDQS
uniref:Alpha 1,4-glycosyltransferase domain-containing protein n=1 Tax=Chrysotila carterae TaxID=13221 RepID=A0A6S9V4Q1_CHRCT